MSSETFVLEISSLCIRCSTCLYLSVSYFCLLKFLAWLTERFLKPCPHCRRKVRLSQKTARQRRQSPNSANATVAVFGDKLSHFSATVWTGFKPCPRCRRKVRLSPKTATVAEKCDCRRKRRDNGDSRRIRRQTQTVAVFGDKLSQFSATVWTGFYKDIHTYILIRNSIKKTTFIYLFTINK